MGWFRRSSNLVSGAYRCYTSMNSTIPKNHTHFLTSSSPRRNFSIPTVRHYSRPIFRNSGLHNGNPFFDIAKRFYSVDRTQLHHFAHFKQGWFRKLRNLLTAAVVISGASITLYFGQFDTVPFSKRTRFMICSTSLERSLGDYSLKQFEQMYEGNILPPTHPDNMRVQKILQEIIEALQRVLEKEILDDKRVKSQIAHLEGLKWEVIVVADPVDMVCSMPGGKIVLCTGFLEKFGSDIDIATVLGHEVGHIVARHSMEKTSNAFWLMFIIPFIMLIMFQILMLDVFNTMSKLLVLLPSSRRIETEADNIGLILLASAGYDPRVAPLYYERRSDSNFEKPPEFLSTHPSGKKRAKSLAKAKVMEESLRIYRGIQTGQDFKGQLSLFSTLN